MTADHEATIRAAVEQLTAAILAAAREEAAPGVPEQLLSVDQASARLSIGRSALYGELAAGRLRSLSVGRRRLIPASAIREYVERASQ